MRRSKRQRLAADRDRAGERGASDCRSEGPDVGDAHYRAPMMPIRSKVRAWLATGHADMRKGFHGLALLVQEKLKRDPHLALGREYSAA